MKNLELNDYEYNTLLVAIEKEYYYQLDKAKNEKPLTDWDIKCGMISWKTAAEQTLKLYQNLGSFTAELNNSSKKIVKLIQE
jgi:hypothetical protein